MIEVHLGSERFETVRSGITTRHCFSAGAHYDPDNVSFGPLIAVDEHLVGPGDGFARHAHRGVNIVTWVLDGRLRHEDSVGGTTVGAGVVLVQLTGTGIEHVERNASHREPLRFVQMSFLGETDRPRSEIGEPPLAIAGTTFTVLLPELPTYLPAAPYVHVYLARGRALIADVALSDGDSVRLRDESVRIEGEGELLVLSLPAPPTVEV